MAPRCGGLPSSDSRTSLAACKNGLMISARIGHLLSGSQELVQRAEHTVGLKRLQNEVLRPGSESLHHDRLLAHSGDHGHPCGWVELADLLERLEAVHLRHGDVH